MSDRSSEADSAGVKTVEAQHAGAEMNGAPAAADAKSGADATYSTGDAGGLPATVPEHQAWADAESEASTGRLPVDSSAEQLESTDSALAKQTDFVAPDSGDTDYDSIPKYDMGAGMDQGDASYVDPPDSPYDFRPRDPESSYGELPDYEDQSAQPGFSMDGNDGDPHPPTVASGNFAATKDRNGQTSLEVGEETAAVRDARSEVDKALAVADARDGVDAAYSDGEAGGLPTTSQEHREDVDAAIETLADRLPGGSPSKQVEFQGPASVKEVPFVLPDSEDGAAASSEDATVAQTEESQFVQDEIGADNVPFGVHDTARSTTPIRPDSPSDLHDTRTENEFRADYGDEFLPPMNQVSEQIEPFSSPEALAERINPDFDSEMDAYSNNCADCARSFERSWRGNLEEAAGRSYEVGDQSHPGLFADGEPSGMTEEWAARTMDRIEQPTDLRAALEQGEHGSSAVVHSTWRDADGDPHGHAYNVVNDHGTIKTVDPQTHEVFAFDDDSIRPGIAADGTHAALVWDGSGRVLHV